VDVAAPALPACRRGFEIMGGLVMEMSGLFLLNACLFRLISFAT